MHIFISIAVLLLGGSFVAMSEDPVTDLSALMKKYDTKFKQIDCLSTEEISGGLCLYQFTTDEAIVNKWLYECQLSCEQIDPLITCINDAPLSPECLNGFIDLLTHVSVEESQKFNCTLESITSGCQQIIVREWTQWTAFTECFTHEDGKQTRTRTRVCRDPLNESDTGTGCRGIGKKTCHVSNCSEPLDEECPVIFEWTQWSSYSGCRSDEHMTKKTRACIDVNNHRTTSDTCKGYTVEGCSCGSLTFTNDGETVCSGTKTVQATFLTFYLVLVKLVFF